METMESLFISTKPELLVTGFVFTEGPLWHPDEVLYVSDVDAQIHYKVQLGEKVVTLLNNSYSSAGYHNLNWNATGYPSGMYFIKVQTPSVIDTKKALLVK